MKRILSILIFLLLCSPSYGMNVVMMSGEGTSTAGETGTETIGNETAGDSVSSINSSYIYCGKVTELPAHNGSVNSVTVSFHKGTATNGEVHIAIYTHDSGNDIPANLVANSGTGAIAITNSTPVSDYTHTYTGTKPTVSSGTQYWICFQAAAANEVDYGSTETGGRRSLCTLDTYGSWPATVSNQGTGTTLFGKLYFVNGY